MLVSVAWFNRPTSARIGWLLVWDFYLWALDQEVSFTTHMSLVSSEKLSVQLCHQGMESIGTYFLRFAPAGILRHQVSHHVLRVSRRFAVGYLYYLIGGAVFWGP